MCFGEKNEIDPIWGWSLHLSYLVGGCGRVVGAVSGSRCWCGVAAERRSNSQNGGRQSMENFPMLALLPTSWEVEIMWASGLRMWSRQEQEQWHLAYKSCHLAKISTKIMCLGHFQLLDKTAWMHLKCVLCKRIYTFYFSHMSET